MASRQYKWQEKKLKEGKCITCGKPASKINKRFCETHRIYWNKNFNKFLNKTNQN